MVYPYFTFNTEDYEKNNFPDEQLWEQACKRCAPWSLNDFNVAAIQYAEEKEIEEYIERGWY